MLYWTGGHPYLTQRFCQALAADSRAKGDAGADRLCEELFLSAAARENDNNLSSVGIGSSARTWIEAASWICTRKPATAGLCRTTKPIR